jgi:hypothetical protein
LPPVVAVTQSKIRPELPIVVLSPGFRDRPLPGENVWPRSDSFANVAKFLVNRFAIFQNKSFLSFVLLLVNRPFEGILLGRKRSPFLPKFMQAEQEATGFVLRANKPKMTRNHCFAMLNCVRLI